MAKSSLKTYWSKRKFGKTPEPEGKTRQPSVNPKFVIHKHEATRTHFDVRLEIDGVYKSWAVPKGPSLNPTVSRLAVHVEDHPLDYGDFEGVIPKGNYGAGPVMIWDRGTYYVKLGSIESGRLTFVLSGEKLRGEFSLIKLKGKDPKAWLMVKKRDGEAVYGNVEDENPRSVASGRTMDEIRGGKRSAPTEKALTHLRLYSVRLMQPLSTRRPPPVADWIYMPFLKGIRATAEIGQHGVKIFSRDGLPLHPRFPEVARALQNTKIRSALLDGIIVDGKKFVAQDLISVDGKDLRAEETSARLKQLKKLKVEQSAWAESADKIDAPELLLKRADAAYRGGLSRDWLKISATAAGSKKAKPGRTGGTDELPPLTHPDKIYFPKDGYKKRDLYEYYKQIAPWIVPHLMGRPESMHRQPDGIRNQGFFHKDVTGFLPRRIKTVRVYSESSGKTMHYILCQDRYTLLYLANWGCIELNPWLSREPHLDKPDYSVIDLDPDGNSFEEVMEVARETHRVLTKVGLKAWCKTSGATGLHICVPLGAKYDFDTSKEFAELVCHVVHRTFPNFTSVERNPARRRGKIYLDFLQNRRGQTLAAPYCVRPHDGAPVSTPLKWTELKKGLNPSQFTIRTIEKRLARVGDLWKTMQGKTSDIPAAMKRLTKLLDQSAKP